MTYAEQKVAGGKFVRVYLDNARHVHLDGDFFMADEPIPQESYDGPFGEESDAAAPVKNPDSPLTAIAQELTALAAKTPASVLTAQLTDETTLFNAAAMRIEPFMGAIAGIDAAAVAHAFVRVMFADANMQPNIVVLDQTAANWSDASNSSQDLTDDQIHAFWRELLPKLTVIVDVARDPADQMAQEELWSQQVVDGLSGPVLRLWNWQSRAIVVGRFQSIEREIHQDIAQELGFTIVRRSTGGGAMVVIPQDTITYSLYLPLAMVRDFSVDQIFTLCDSWLVKALNELGVPARFAGLNDIAGEHGKIGGSAERRYRATAGSAGEGALLHHTTLAYHIDAQTMTRVLNTSAVKMSDKHVKSAKKRVDPMGEYTDLSRDELADALVQFLARSGAQVRLASPDKSK